VAAFWSTDYRTTRKDYYHRLYVWYGSPHYQTRESTFARYAAVLIRRSNFIQQLRFIINKYPSHCSAQPSVGRDGLLQTLAFFYFSVASDTASVLQELLDNYGGLYDRCCCCCCCDYHFFFYYYYDACASLFYVYFSTISFPAIVSFSPPVWLSPTRGH
jgi:hypothetical protein